jgi:hypothetical protein
VQDALHSQIGSQCAIEKEQQFLDVPEGQKSLPINELTFLVGCKCVQKTFVKNF